MASATGICRAVPRHKKAICRSFLFRSRRAVNALRLRLTSRSFRGGREGQSNGDVLVVGSAGDRIAIATLGEQIDLRPICQTLAVRRGVGLTVAMRERELAVPHRVVDLAAGDKAPDRGFNGNPVTILAAQ